MTTNNSEPLNEEASLANAEDAATTTKNKPPNTSATTPDVPAFGWSAYAERVNGRFAMVGFIAILLIELFSREAFLLWAGLIH